MDKAKRESGQESLAKPKSSVGEPLLAAVAQSLPSSLSKHNKRSNIAEELVEQAPQPEKPQQHLSKPKSSSKELARPISSGALQSFQPSGSKRNKQHGSTKHSLEAPSSTKEKSRTTKSLSEALAKSPSSAALQSFQSSLSKHSKGHTVAKRPGETVPSNESGGVGRFCFCYAPTRSQCAVFTPVHHQYLLGCTSGRHHYPGCPKLSRSSRTRQRSSSSTSSSGQKGALVLILNNYISFL